MLYQLSYASDPPWGCKSGPAARDKGLKLPHAELPLQAEFQDTNSFAANEVVAQVSRVHFSGLSRDTTASAGIPSTNYSTQIAWQEQREIRVRNEWLIVERATE
jgi:hypothetical protein